LLSSGFAASITFSTVAANNAGFRPFAIRVSGNDAPAVPEAAPAHLFANDGLLTIRFGTGHTLTSAQTAHAEGLAIICLFAPGTGHRSPAFFCRALPALRKASPLFPTQIGARAILMFCHHAGTRHNGTKAHGFAASGGQTILVI
jgi:hypothetical protein